MWITYTHVDDGKAMKPFLSKSLTIQNVQSQETAHQYSSLIVTPVTMAMFSFWSKRDKNNQVMLVSTFLVCAMRIQYCVYREVL